MEPIYAASTSVAGKRRKRRNVILSAVSAFAAVLISGGVAWAVMNVSSNEASAKVEAGQIKDLELSDAKVIDDAKLFPGTGVAIYFTVKNPNPIPVTVTSIVAGTSNPTVTCAAPADVAKLSSSLLVQGNSVQLPTAVQLDPGESKTVTIANAVKLASTATGGCTIEGKFKLQGTGAGSGN